MNYKEIIAIIAAFAILDGIWILLNLPMYKRMYSSVQCGSPMKINALGAICAYVFMFIAFAFIVLPRLRKTEGTFVDCLREGGLFGLCAYGIYNFTNLATFNNYSLKVAIIDTLWGATLYTLTALILMKMLTA